MRDRTGEPVEPDDDSAPWHDPRCRGTGWLGDDNEGRPIPCLVCKAHLATRSTVHETTPSPRAQAAIRALESRE
ncbi:hypothetical protein D5S18_18520 [Nocardia panacis]|uniref:Uncharacterized protein n=1 Tax=Nocardia panacis TaxID=2340916 RepID=A0A3A4K639_9NOCA|nr:hypothetical protein [Nocardia panacis]RJO74148.1 hypothetical protein D5S18_18520 [Nocardia panacis]